MTNKTVTVSASKDALIAHEADDFAEFNNKEAALDRWGGEFVEV
jgi:hypothetical protein